MSDDTVGSSTGVVSTEASGGGGVAVSYSAPGSSRGALLGGVSLLLAAARKDQECGGIRAILTDRNRCPVVDIGIELAVVLGRLYPSQFEIGKMDRLLGDDETLNAIRIGNSLAQIKAGWAKGLAAYEERRQAALLYK